MRIRGDGANVSPFPIHSLMSCCRVRRGCTTKWLGFGLLNMDVHANTLATCNDSNVFSAVGSTIIELSRCWTQTLCAEEGLSVCWQNYPFEQDHPFPGVGGTGVDIQFGPVCGHPQGPIQIDGRLEIPSIVTQPDGSAPGSTTTQSTPASSSESFEECQEMSRSGKVAWDLDHIQFSSYAPTEHPLEMYRELLSDGSFSHQRLFSICAIY